MKVALVIKALSTQGGGAERIFVGLAAYLAEKGHFVQILSFDRKDQQSFYPLDKRVLWKKLGIGDASKRAKPLETFTRIVALRTAIRLSRPDVVVGFMHSSYVLLALSLVGLSIPIVGSEHIVIQHYYRRPLQYLLLLLSTFFIRRFTVLSEKAKGGFSWLFRRKAIVMPDPVFPHGGKAEKPEANTSSLLLSVGKLEPQKDHLTLIRAFAQLASRYPGWHLRIVGEGSMRRVLEYEVRSLGMQSRISLPGASKEIGSEYAAAEIFVIPSRYESFGLVTVEAMAAGLPVVGFKDCSGVNEVVQHQVNGILVETDDRVTNLADALSRVIEDGSLRGRLVEAGLRKANEYRPEWVYSRWVDLLEEVVKRS